MSSYLPFNFLGNFRFYFFHPAMTSDTILVPEVVSNPFPKFHFGIESHPVPHVMIICHLVHNNNNETL